MDTEIPNNPPTEQEAFDAHWRQQVLFIVDNTTPAQRMAWLEEMLEMLRPQMPELLRNREMLHRH